VDALQLMPAVTATPGGDAAEARRRALADPFPWLLLVDTLGRPLGWVDQADLPTSGQLDESLASAMSPTFDRRTTLKDALARLIEAEVQAGVVVDAKGAVLGLVTAEMIFDWSRQTAEEARRQTRGSRPADATGEP
jgi:osmoprotectant transport system ATP-binding protein